MAVFPSQSRKFLPSEWQSLMIEKESPIIDFYPLDFCVDLNGKRYEWQGVALLPFVDENRLHHTLERVYPTLTNEERKRNRRDYDRLYIHSSNLCYDYFKRLYVPGENEVTKKDPLDIPTMLSEGMAGRVWPDDDDNIKPIGEHIEPPLPNCEDISNNQVICVKYRDLSFDANYIFKAKLLENVSMPQATLKPRDYDQMTSYRPNIGFAQRPQYQRDFATAQRFIRHSMGSQQFHQHQSDRYSHQSYPASSFPQRQSDRYSHQSYSASSFPQRQSDRYFHQTPPARYFPQSPTDSYFSQRQPRGFIDPRQSSSFSSQHQSRVDFRYRQPNSVFLPRNQKQYHPYRPNY